MSNKLSAILSDIDTSVHPESLQDNTNEGNTISPDTPKIFPIYICINEYSKRMEDELDMKPGDKIQVITDDEEYNDGWYFGRNLRTQEEGLYPVVFTQVISTEKKPTLMRAKSVKRLNSPSGVANPGLTNNNNNNKNNSYLPSPNESNSTISTPLELQTASVAPFSKYQNDQEVNKTNVTDSENISVANNRRDKYTLSRNISMKSTMSDIDKAIEELNYEPTESLNTVTSDAKESIGYSMAEDTMITETEDLNLVDQPKRSGTVLSGKSQSQDNVKDIQEKAKFSNPKNVSNWSPEEVSNYFIDCGFDVESASRFKRHKISGAILLELELAHLKELDINSFGTRFEMYKEIESLKKNLSTDFAVEESRESNTLKGPVPISKDLMPPAHVDKDTQRLSQSMVELSTTNSDRPVLSKKSSSSNNNSNNLDNNRPISLMINDQLTKDIRDGTIILPIAEDLENEDLFASPRRAPKPPSYPSPVQPPKSPMMNIGKNYTPKTSSKLTYSPLPLYQNKKEPTVRPSTEGKEESDNSQVINNLQVPKNESLTIPASNKEIDKMSLDSDRPTSSIYESPTSSNSISQPPAQSTMTEDIEKKHDEVEDLTNNSSGNKVKRNSSLLSYFGKGEKTSNGNSIRKSTSFTVKRKDAFITSPIRREFTEHATGTTPDAKNSKSLITSPVKKDTVRSVSAKDQPTRPIDMSKKILEDDKNKRSVSEVMKPKTLRAMTTRAPLKKQNTTAFMEGLRDISVRDALKTADYSGWMSKKGSGTMSTWRTRFFILEGTRLSYFTSTTDTKERGLIDITGYRVVPARDDDKFVALFAATAGKGRYCFKLLPPQPGSRKGLTFTEPRVHYFAVDTKEEMRGWMASLLKTTIDIDTSVPVISSYSTPTVSLSKAKEMLAQARRETEAREEKRLLDKKNNGENDGSEAFTNNSRIKEGDEDEDEGRRLWEEQHNIIYTGGSSSSIERSEERVEYKTRSTDNSKSTEDGIFSNLQRINTAGNTSVGSNTNGFASPYLLASGMLSPSIGHKTTSPQNTSSQIKKSNEDYFTGGVL